MIFEALDGHLLHRLRVVLVGMGGVGKSSLFEALFLERALGPNDHPTSTHDVSLVRPTQNAWKPSVRIANRQTSCTPHVWDFGGQIVLHGVHEEFLRPDGRSVYVLCAAANRVPQRLPNVGYGEELGNGVDYWLRTVGAFAGLEAPVVVAITQCDGFRERDNRKIDQPLARDRPSLTECEPASIPEHLDDCVTVSSLVDDISVRPGPNQRVRAEVYELRRQIAKAAAHLPELPKRFPPQTETLIKRIEAFWRDKSTISRDDFLGLCVDLGLKEKDDPSDAMLQVMRSLGVVFYFGRTDEQRYDERRDGDHQTWRDAAPHGERALRRREPTAALQETVFNPYWLKWPLYEVMRESERRAFFKPSDIQRLADAGEKEAGERWEGQSPGRIGPDKLRDVIRHIGLCHHIKDRDLYFFPVGVNDDPNLPDWVTEEKRPESIHQTWQWAFLREASLHRFAVALLDSGEIITQDNGTPFVWRRGLVMQDIAGPCRACLRADFDRSEAKLIVHGGDEGERDRLLAGLRRQFASFAPGLRTTRHLDLDGVRIEPGDGGKDTDPPSLTDNQIKILQLLAGEGKSDKNHRIKGKDICRLIHGVEDATPLRKQLANLTSLGLLESQDGPSGGYWLTKHGKRLAESL